MHYPIVVIIEHYCNFNRQEKQKEECIMCLAIPMKVISIEGNNAVVSAGGTKKEVRLDIVDEMPQIGDYVIVHELLHFRVPNHGKLWKSYMRAYLGEYERIEKRLKKLVRHKALNNDLLISD